MKNKEQIVIVGFGWVGQANALALLSMRYSVAYFDPKDTPRHYSAYKDNYDRIERLAQVKEKDSEQTIYVVCVGDRVSDEGVQDIGAIKSALDALKNVKGTVVLRSTIVPDTLEKLTFDYYVPEFLHEKTAVTECMSPHFVVVGKNKTTKEEPSFLALWRTKTPRQFDGTPKEAAFIKYLSNLWNAIRIAFVNEFGDAITSPSSPEKVASIHRVIDFVLEGGIYQRYGQAFGGHCLPKDTRAFSYWYKNSGSGTSLLEGVLKANEGHSKLETTHKDIPEWFSSWPSPHVSGFVALRELLYSIKKNLIHPKAIWARYRIQFIWGALGVVLVTLFLWGVFI